MVLGRRAALTLGLGGLSYLALGRLGLAGEDATKRAAERPRSLILVWLNGGPSQLETFDPKPLHKNGGPTKAIATSIKSVQLAAGMEQVAEQLQHLALVRAVVGQEGDHERASVLMKTGRRPEVNLRHPSLGAVCAHELPAAGTEIPRYITVLGEDRAATGGFLGPRFDPYSVDDPADPIQDVQAPVGAEREARRLDLLASLEERYAAQHHTLEARASHRDRTARALRTMRSPQLKAFDIDSEPAAARNAYGDTAFGRGCLMARRLVEVGVRCTEVTLGGWDTHVNNFGAVAAQTRVLDPALAALIRDLRERDLWQSTLVMCCGEFGRTPNINPGDGRDHWPRGFSVLLGGAGIAPGIVLGDTGKDGTAANEPTSVADVYATALHAMGIDPERENTSNAGRPVRLGEGTPLARLLPQD